MRTFTHPAVARARKEAAQECAKIAAEVREEAFRVGYYSSDPVLHGIITAVNAVEERIRQSFGLEAVKGENS